MTDGYLAREPDVEWAEIDGEVLALFRGTLHRLAGAAGEIWIALDGTRTTADLAATFQARYAVPGVGAGVESAVAGLWDHGLVRMRADPPLARVAPTTAWTEQADGVVAMDLRQPEPVVLSESGSAIWWGVVDGLSQDELVDRIVTTYGVEPESVVRDVRATIAELTSLGLVEPSGMAARD